ncbi:hypothetical protein [Lichenifustis flavocetrariae]|uniref:Uncharacterized protein n=1 Tax=Lichenifustis flavocetrariae TaxID=2949735 RepID=A0AA41Z3N2_9HYPH|nr:hypothetical protein [Lichenifustis flavocetrariae]MCW6513119.1 hypothetical protein [Lichenifustis flavocetrariae]
MAAAGSVPPLEADAVIDFALEADNQTGSFGTLTAVRGVTLRIPKGQLYGVFSPNGAALCTEISVLSRWQLVFSRPSVNLGSTL